MAFTKHATFEQAEVLALKGAPSQQHFASLERIADFENYRTGDGYLYVRIRAISSRVNRNSDGWPSVELAGSPEIFERHHSGGGFTVEAAEGNPEFGFATFIGKPIFVDHHNSNPKKARGVIVDAKLNVLDHRLGADDYWTSSEVDKEHLPPTEVELLLEVDANSFPTLAKAITSGDLDGFSMGCDVEKSKCSHCGHIATNPEEYCSHILMKGAHHDLKTADGKRTSKKSYENCYGIKFFEISAVFDPADETALAREVRSAVNKEADLMPGAPPGYAGERPDPARPGQAQEVQSLAMHFEMQGMDPQTAMQMAQEKITQQQGLPGHGEGEGYALPKHTMPGLPEGMPPPVRNPGRVPGGFAEGIEDALNERYPNRPVMNNPMMSSTKTAENPLPQEFNTHAPEEIDTLRDEQLCPICGNDMDSETCSVCGYVAPPKEFDNPDLNQATEIREKMKEQEGQAAQGITQPGDQLGQPSENGTPPGGPLTGEQPKKAPATATVKSDMRWTPKVHPKTAARINQVERPITPSNPPQSDEPRNEHVIKDQTRPVTAAMATAQQLMANAQRNHGERMNTHTADGPTPPGDTSPKTQVDVTGVGGFDDASNEAASKAEAQIDVTGVGTTGVSDVSADKTESIPTAGRDSDDSGFNTEKSTDDSGPTATFGDSDGGHSGVGDPVTHEPFPASEDAVKRSGWRQAYEDGTLEGLDQQGDPVAGGGSAVKGVQPIAESFGERVNVLEHKTSPSNNSGPTTTWTGTDGNGVLKQQDPVTQDSMEWGGVKTPDIQLHTTGRVSIAALRLAEVEIELGLLDNREKWNRLAELDTQDPALLHAQLKTLSKVKTAGLNKLAQHRQSSVRSLPKAFGKQTAAPDGFQRIATGAEQVEQAPITDESLDAGLFLR